MSTARIRGRLAVVATAAVAVTVVSACGSRHDPAPPCPTDPPVHGLAIAAGGHAGSARPSLPPEPDPSLDAVAAAAARGEQGIGATVVRVDGRPSVACVVRYDTSAGNDTARKVARKTFAATARQRTADVTAQVPEANPLEALAVAAAAAGPGGTVVLADSGLQTVAPLDFRQPGLLDADPARVADALRTAGMLPDLRGRTMVLDGIGYTAAPQDALTTAQRANLLRLWERIVTAAGADTVRTVETPNTTTPLPGLPAVSSVSLPSPQALDLACNTTSILSDDGPVGFRPGGTEFVDPAAARQVLGRFAGWLADNQGARGHVVGSIAHYGANSSTGLAADRADRVRDVLVELGADTAAVTAEGIGWGPFPTATAPPGPADPLNRRVVIELSCS